MFYLCQVVNPDKIFYFQWRLMQTLEHIVSFQASFKLNSNFDFLVLRIWHTLIMFKKADVIVTVLSLCKSEEEIVKVNCNNSSMISDDWLDGKDRFELRRHWDWQYGSIFFYKIASNKFSYRLYM